jgi:hypothetical protein
MQAQANIYEVEILESWVNLTRNGYEAVFEVEYDDKRFVAGHTFNDPTLYWEWKRYNDSGQYEAAEELLQEAFWMYVQDGIASQIEDQDELELITTPKQKKDARYHSEN